MNITCWTVSDLKGELWTILDKKRDPWHQKPLFWMAYPWDGTKVSESFASEESMDVFPASLHRLACKLGLHRDCPDVHLPQQDHHIKVIHTFINLNHMSKGTFSQGSVCSTRYSAPSMSRLRRSTRGFPSAKIRLWKENVSWFDKLSTRSTNLKRGRHCIWMVLLLCSVAIPCIVPSEREPSSNSTFSGLFLQHNPQPVCQWLQWKVVKKDLFLAKWSYLVERQVCTLHAFLPFVRRLAYWSQHKI